MEYPNVAIAQDQWNKLFKKNTTQKLNPKQKYIDIPTNKVKKGKTTKKNANSLKKGEKKTKKSVCKKKDQKSKSIKKQRVLKAPVNFM